LPGNLRKGLENLTSLPLDGVQVHYNSARPARLRALAYTEGEDIHLGPNQEKHLPHEAWHTVQQMQGRVRPTLRMTGLAINDDPALEREAEVMGAKALRSGAGQLAPAWTRPVPAAGEGSHGLVIQRLPGNGAYDKAIEILGDQDLEENYLDLVGRNVETDARPAFIVNTILSYSEVGKIEEVIRAIVEGTKRPVAVVLGINAPQAAGKELDQAIQKAEKTIAGFDFPVVIVKSTWKGKTFPFGTMRNEVMHSKETKALTRHFASLGHHPYISIQDFDTGSRKVPGKEALHIFDVLDQLMADQGPHPLMIAGGYRSGEDLVASTTGRFKAKGEEVPEALTTGEGKAFSEEFAEHISTDMASRQEYAKIHPLLPYSPEPNLFLDALAVAYGSQLGLEPLNFGKGAAEFTQLAKLLPSYEKAELAHHYGALHESAPSEMEVENIPKEKLLINRKDIDLDKELADLDKELAKKRGREELDRDQEEIENQLSVDVQTGRHPRRGQTYLVDFTNLTVETDLSRLAYSYLYGKDPQSHIGFSIVADRFFDTKTAKKGTSMDVAQEKLLALDPKERQSSLKELLFPSDEAEEGNARKKPKLANQSYMPKRTTNLMSSALSTSFGAGPFSSYSTGIQPSQKMFAFGATALILSQAKLRLLADQLILGLKSIGNGTPMDGNCLYHAIIQVGNGGQVDDDRAAGLRQETVTWALNNLDLVSQYAFDHGVDIDNLIDTLSKSGNWAGTAGDLTPQIVASAINRNIRIVTTTGNVYTIQPLAGPGAATITLQLEHQHYSVPQQQQQTSSSSSSSSTMND